MRHPDIPLRKGIAPQAAKALRAFSRRGERLPPPAFAGRSDVLKAIGEQVEEALDETESIPSHLVISGPPGSGKTSALAEAAKRFRAKDVIPVMLAGEDLSNPVEVVAAALTAAGREGSVPQLAEQRAKSVSGGTDLRLARIKRDVKTTTDAVSADLMAGEKSAWRVIGALVERDPLLLFLVDEAQNAPPFDASRAFHLTASLAQGGTPGIRATTVFAGLSDTPARLARAGASPRLARDAFVLGAFSEAEAEAAVTGFLDHPPFGLSGVVPDAGRRRLARAIAVAGERYPRHVHCYLAELAGQLAERPASVDVGRMLEGGHRRRLAYSRQVVGNARLDSRVRPILSRRLDAAGRNGAVSHAGLVDEIVDRTGRSAALAEESVEWIVHCGLLEPSPSARGMLRVPIPSLRTYLCAESDDDALAEMARECDRALKAKAGPSP